MSKANQSQRKDHSPQDNEGLHLRATVCSYTEWAKEWFAGRAYCPLCRGNDLGIRRSHADDVARIEEWQCYSRVCAARWQVKLRESAVGIYFDDDALDVNWYERT